MFYALVFYAMTGWHLIVTDHQATCDYWLASNATRLHGALYANGPTSWEDPPEARRCLRLPDARAR
jgi:hypothetical protein